MILRKQLAVLLLAGVLVLHAATFMTVKDPNSTVDITIDWSACLACGNQVSVSQWSTTATPLNTLTIVSTTIPQGTVNTSGTAVVLTAGDPFAPIAGNIVPIVLINGTAYNVASVTDNSHLVLTTSAGTQTGVSYKSVQSRARISGGQVQSVYTLTNNVTFASGQVRSATVQITMRNP